MHCFPPGGGVYDIVFDCIIQQNSLFVKSARYPFISVPDFSKMRPAQRINADKSPPNSISDWSAW